MKAWSYGAEPWGVKRERSTSSICEIMCLRSVFGLNTMETLRNGEVGITFGVKRKEIDKEIGKFLKGFEPSTRMSEEHMTESYRRSCSRRSVGI